jgi:3-methyl-2-oxobutanoate hydroxymethyltransferase
VRNANRLRKDGRADAIALDEAGAVGTVLELVTTTAASAVTEAIDGMTIGIGAGSGCNAQVVTLHDLLGLGEVLPETAAGIGTDLGTAIVEHLNGFHGAVASGEFPDGNATEPMAEDEADDFARDT